jgi:D-alanyl-D-alanine carboxypeptidase
MPAPTGSRRAIPARRASTSWPPHSAGRNGSSQRYSAGDSAAWRNQRIMELLDMGFARAPSNATDPRARPAEYDNDGPASRTLRPNGLVARSPTPLPARPASARKSALVAAIGEAVQDAVGEALMEPATTPVSRSARGRGPRADRGAGGARARRPSPTPAVKLIAAAPDPSTRSAGRPLSRRPASGACRAPRSSRARPRPAPGCMACRWARRPRTTRPNDCCFSTALAELGTFDDALRRVVQRSGGYEARFAGMTEIRRRAPAPGWTHRNMTCETFGP